MCGARGKLPSIAVPRVARHNAIGCRAAGQHLALGVSHRLLVVSLSDRRGQLGLRVLLRVGKAVAGGASMLDPQWALEALT